MATRMDDYIDQMGSAVEIHRMTEGAEDDYGDPAQTWAKQADEVVWIQRKGSRSFEHSEAGKIDESASLGLFKSASVAIAKDQVKIGGLTYEVVAIDPITEYGQVSHKEGQLRLEVT